MNLRPATGRFHEPARQYHHTTGAARLPRWSMTRPAGLWAPRVKDHLGCIVSTTKAITIITMLLYYYTFILTTNSLVLVWGGCRIGPDFIDFCVLCAQLFRVQGFRVWGLGGLGYRGLRSRVFCRTEMMTSLGRSQVYT